MRGEKEAVNQASHRRLAAVIVIAVSLLLMTLAPGAQAAYAPAANGRFVVAMGEPRDIWIAKPDGTDPVNLTSARSVEHDYGGTISPNGRLIVFNSYVPPAGHNDLWLMRSNGKGLRRLTNTPLSDEALPSFTADGRAVLFETNSAGQSDIWRLTLRGGATANLTPGPEDDYEPSPSPDGRSVVFYRDSGIWVVASDGSIERQVEPFPGASSPAISPRGDLIALTNFDGMQADAWTVRPDGSGEINITPGSPEYEFDTAFAPDSRRIALADDGGPTLLRRLDGSDPVPLPALANVNTISWEHVFRCKGRRATIVGDAGPDKLRGTPKADVIVGNAGRDRIRGRGGRDRICGNAGRDRLIGGGGRDRLVGGPGRDAVVQ